MKPIRVAPLNVPPSRPRDEHWTTEAACANPSGIDVMDGAHDNSRWWTTAKAICRDCPVRDICAREHLAEEWGVYGGLDPNERAALRGDSPNGPPAPVVCQNPHCGKTFTPALGRGPKVFCTSRCRELHGAERLRQYRVRKAAEKVGAA